MAQPFDNKLKVWKRVDFSNSQVSMTSTTTETTLYSFDVPTTWVDKVDTTFKITIFGTFKHDETASDITLVLKLDTTAIVTVVKQFADVNTEVGGYILEAILHCPTDAIQKAILRLAGSRTTAAVDNADVMCEYGSGTVDMSAETRTLAVTCDFETSSAGIIVTKEVAILEMLLSEN